MSHVYPQAARLVPLQSHKPIWSKVLDAKRARKYAHLLMREWRKGARDFQICIRDVPDPDLRFVIAHMVHGTATAKLDGAWRVDRTGDGGFALAEVVLDGGVLDTVIERLGSRNKDVDAYLDAGFSWVGHMTRECSLPWFVWALGPVDLMAEADQDPKVHAQDRVVYSFPERRLLGVHTHPHFRDVKDRIIPLKFPR